MDKLRILPVALICGLLSAPALGQLTTIGPSTQGVSEFILTLRQTSVVDGVASYAPILTPVIPLGSPAGGGGLFDWNLAYGDLNFPSSSCLSGCLGVPDLQPSDFTEFAVTFSKPVSFVDVLQLQYQDDNGGAFAYNAQGQLVASCGGYFDYGLPNNGTGGCYSFVAQANPANQSAITSMALSASGIVAVVAGGYGDVTGGVTAVKFSTSSVPEPGTFPLIVLALAGLAVTRKRWA